MRQPNKNEKQIGAETSERVLAWYDTSRRHLPWRADPGVVPDAYHIWLSEIMLQQTTVATVGPYFQRFLDLWPSVTDLAKAPLDAVLTEWAGLGYYARARNLHKCAVMVAEDFAGAFPDTEEALRALPGIGRYTAAAIAAIAFGRRAVVVDGNIERVMARLFDIDTPLPGVKPLLTEKMDLCTPQTRAGDFAQALMDIGATVCTPRKPLCTLCPMADLCLGKGRAESLPKKAPKKAKPTRYGTAYWIINSKGEVLFRKRPETGLLGGMVEPPSSPWSEADAAPDGPDLSQAPMGIEPVLLPGQIRHTFTHFHLVITVAVYHIASDKEPLEGAFWRGLDQLGDLALPTVMRKIVTHAVQHTATV